MEIRGLADYLDVKQSILKMGIAHGRRVGRDRPWVWQLEQKRDANHALEKTENSKRSMSASHDLPPFPDMVDSEQLDSAGGH